MYWLNVSGADTSELRQTLIETAKKSKNLIELYYYKLALGNSNKVFNSVPDNAKNLCKKIKGNKKYEDLLYEELGWQRK